MEISKIAPVVMSLGNYELYLTKEDEEVLTAANVSLLNNSSVKIKGILSEASHPSKSQGRSTQSSLGALVIWMVTRFFSAITRSIIHR